MRSRWTDDEAAAFVARYGGDHGEALALRTYSSRLLGKAGRFYLIYPLG